MGTQLPSCRRGGDGVLQPQVPPRDDDTGGCLGELQSPFLPLLIAMQGLLWVEAKTGLHAMEVMVHCPCPCRPDHPYRMYRRQALLRLMRCPSLAQHTCLKNCCVGRGHIWCSKAFWRQHLEDSTHLSASSPLFLERLK